MSVTLNGLREYSGCRIVIKGREITGGDTLLAGKSLRVDRELTSEEP